MNTDDPASLRALGCFLGLALGDALGAPFEGGPLERLVWKIIGRAEGGARRYTDDTQMSLDLAGSLLACGGLDQADLAARFAQSYRWSRGYGPGAAKTLKKIRRGVPWEQANRAVYATGSLGNGGAMRAPVLALFFEGEGALREAARASAEVTHAHPEGVQGAVSLAMTTRAALRGAAAHEIMEVALAESTLEAFQAPLQCAQRWLVQGEEASPQQVRRELGTRITAAGSCPAAIYLACVHLERDFEDMLAFARACGGDVDTVSAMAGALWGAWRGVQAIPEALAAQLEDRGVILDLARRLWAQRQP